VGAANASDGFAPCAAFLVDPRGAEVGMSLCVGVGLLLLNVSDVDEAEVLAEDEAAPENMLDSVF